MSYPPSGEGQYPSYDPNQPQQPSGPASTPPYSDPYAAQPGSPAAPYGQQQQPGYPQQSYYQGGYPPPAYPQGGYPPPQRGTNTMAILALVFAFVFSPAGIVLGHIAKKQIAETGEEGSGLATAGLVLSYIFTGISLLACCSWLGLVIWAGSQSSY